jgi:hypothetical protein
VTEKLDPSDERGDGTASLKPPFTMVILVAFEKLPIAPAFVPTVAAHVSATPVLSNP